MPSHQLPLGSSRANDFFLIFGYAIRRLIIFCAFFGCLWTAMCRETRLFIVCTCVCMCCKICGSCVLSVRSYDCSRLRAVLSLTATVIVNYAACCKKRSSVELPVVKVREARHRRRSRGDRGIGPPLSGLGDNPPPPLSAVI